MRCALIIRYQRYWEGRGHLGVLVKCMRDLGRQTSTYIDSNGREGQELGSAESESAHRTCF